MKSLNKKIKALFVLFSFLAYMPISMLPTMALDANTTPDLNSSINGGYVGLNPGNGNKFDVNVEAGKGGVAQFDWNSFNVGSNITVDWIFHNANQTAINRVLNSGGMSQIYGKLTSSCANGSCGNERSGNVILINPNGILFGGGSNINLNSFTASTKDINGIRNIQDIIRDGGGYLDGVLTPTVVNGNTKNYKFNGSDQLTAKYKYGNIIAYEPASSINGFGDGVIGVIKADGASFNTGYDKDGHPTTNAIGVNLIADKIDIKDTTIQTYVPKQNADGTYDNNGNYKYYPGISRSSVKLITADGVNFKYDSYGDSQAVETFEKRGVNKNDHGISIADSTIWTGTAQIKNATDANVTIKNSKVIANKIKDNVSGQIAIKSLGDVNIEDSRLETLHASIDDLENTKNLKYGDIDIEAGGNIISKNSRIATLNSRINNIAGKTPVGNINLNAGNGVLIQVDKDSNPNVTSGRLDVAAGGNLNIKAGATDVVIEDTTGKNWVDGLKDVNIEGRNVYIDGVTVQGSKVDIIAGSVDKNSNVADTDIAGYPVGKIEITNAKINAAYDGDKTLNLLGLNTTIKDSLLQYNELNFYNKNTQDNNNLNNVLIKDGTTFFDKDSTDLVLETTGKLIIDNNELKKLSYGNTAAQDQDGNIILKSINDIVTIRNNSNIKANGNITVDAATDATIINSTLASKNGNISFKGNDKAIASNSFLTANNGNIDFATTGNNIGGSNGITILKTEFNSKKNTLTSNNGSIDIMDQSKLIATEGDNTIDAVNGDINIYDTTINAQVGNNTIKSQKGSVSILNNTKVIAAKESNITAEKDIAITKGSNIKAGLNNNLTSKTGKVSIKDIGTEVESTGADVNITQKLSAALDSHYSGTVKAANNINLTVNGTGENITGSSLDRFIAGNKIALDADNKIELSKRTGDLNLKKVDLNSKENNLTAKNGNVIMSDEITLGNKTNKTTIKGKNVKTTGNGEIKANNKKVIVNADKDIDITFSGVGNKNAGLEINSDVNTSGTGDKNQQANNDNLAGKNVKLNAKDKQIAIAKVKADTLEIVDGQNTKLIAATDNRPNTATDNIGPSGGAMAGQGTAYIEVRKVGGWNMDEDVENVDSIPSFYKNHYDEVDGYGQRHQIGAEDGGSILLVYNRKANCDVPDINPIDPGVDNNTTLGLTESTVVRLPRHEEGVSAVAPVLNEITDPTANVIMAAARLTLDEEENDSEDKF